MSWVKRYYPWIFAIIAFVMGANSYNSIREYESMMNISTMSANISGAAYILEGALLTIFIYLLRYISNLKVRSKKYVATIILVVITILITYILILFM